MQQYPSKQSSIYQAAVAVAAGEQLIIPGPEIIKAIGVGATILFGLSGAGASPGTQLLTQFSPSLSGNMDWVTGDTIVTSAVTPTAFVMDNTEPAGETVIHTGASVPAINDIVCIVNAVPANSDWVEVVKRNVTGGSENFTIRDGLSYEQAAVTCYNKAEKYLRPFRVEEFLRMRWVVNNNYTGTPVAVVVKVIAAVFSKVKTEA